MKQETYDELMSLWQELLDEIEDTRDVILNLSESLVLCSSEERLIETNKIISVRGRIDGLMDACDIIRDLTKHAEIDDESVEGQE
jgi:hypothetical protein